MAKGKDVRVTVILKCTNCTRNGANKKSMIIGISRYITQKNRHNMPSQLELRKFYSFCYKHTIYGEIKNRSNRSDRLYVTLPRKIKNDIYYI